MTSNVPRRTPGRPAGAEGLKPIVQAFAAQMVTVDPASGAKISVADLVIRLLFKAALTGNRKAEARIDKLRDQIVGSENVGWLVVPETLPSEEWWRREEIKNKYRKKPTLEDLDAVVREIKEQQKRTD